MGVWSMLEVASMPVMEILLISVLGAFLASDYCKLLQPDAIDYLNKIVFIVFTPCLVFVSLAETVTLDDIISWWFMPVNMGLTFLIGGILGWLVVKILRPKPHLEGLIIAACSSGNLGTIPLVLIPAICDEEESPFGSRRACKSRGLSYVSLSMGVGGFYLWTYTYQLVRGSVIKFTALKAMEQSSAILPSSELEGDLETPQLKVHSHDQNETHMDVELTVEPVSCGEKVDQQKKSLWRISTAFMKQVLKELSAPPNLASIVGLIFGGTTWLRNLVIEDNAPLRVVQHSIQTLGDGTIPSAILIMGGNLTQGFRSSAIKPLAIIGVICVRYMVLPAIGIVIVKMAKIFGLFPADPLFQYVLMLQYTMPPAMGIGTITQLFKVAQDECSVLFIWTYLVAIFAVTIWSMFFLYLLS